MIKIGNMKYLQNCELFEKQQKDLTAIPRTKSFLQNNKIKCVKFNNTLDKNQTTRCYYACLQLSLDGQQL